MLTKTVIGKKSDAHDSKESSRFARRLKNNMEFGSMCINVKSYTKIHYFPISKARGGTSQKDINNSLNRAFF